MDDVRQFTLPPAPGRAAVIAPILFWVAVVISAPRLSSAFAMNAASLQLAKSSIDYRWTTWGGTDRGEQLLNRVARDAAVRASDSPAPRSTSDTPGAARALAYRAVAASRGADYRRAIERLAGAGDARPWERLALVLADEQAGDHQQALDDVRRTGATGDLLHAVALALTRQDIMNARRAAELAHEASLESAAAAAALGHILATYPDGDAAVRRAIDLLGPIAEAEPADSSVPVDLAHALVLARRRGRGLVDPHAAAAARPP